jgi:hypothetical protein
MTGESPDSFHRIQHEFLELPAIVADSTKARLVPGLRMTGQVNCRRLLR